MTNRLSGVIPALVTPFTADEQFAAPAMEKLLEHLYASGVDGVYVCGQTGEGLLQPIEMRQRVAEVAVRCSPANKTVIIHIGAGRTQDALTLTRHASKVGAHAVSSLPPVGAYTFAEIRQYYETIAAAAEVPVLVYFFPEVAPSIQSFEQILELCAIPNVAGLKFTDFDLFRMSRLAQSGHVVFNGRDEVFAAGLLMGASGGIGTFYNLVPQLFVRLYQHTRNGEFLEARTVQDQINRLIAATLRFPIFSAVKTMLRWSGIDCGPCLAPRRGLSESEEQELQRLLNEAGYTSSCFLQRVSL